MKRTSTPVHASSPLDHWLAWFGSHSPFWLETFVRCSGIHNFLTSQSFTPLENQFLSNGLRFICTPPKTIAACDHMIQQFMKDPQRGLQRFTRTLFNKLLTALEPADAAASARHDIRLAKFSVTQRPRSSSTVFVSMREDEARMSAPADFMFHFDAYRQLTTKLLHGALTDPRLLTLVRRLRPNVSLENRQFIERLMSDPSVTIKPADKNLGMVMVDTDWYVAELKLMLSDRITYTPFRNAVTVNGRSVACSVEQLKQRLTDELKQLVKKFQRVLVSWHPELSDQILKFLSSALPLKDVCVPEIYLLIKVHKSKLCGRPIVPSTKWVTTPASVVLDHLLQEIVNQAGIHWIVKDTKSLVNELERTHLADKQGAFVTADIGSLYTNIDTDDGLRLMEDFLIEQQVPLQRREFLMALLRFVMHNSYLSFSGQTYHQTDGTAMGTAVAPTYANIFVYMLERPLVQEYMQLGLLHLYKRLLDDVFAYLAAEFAMAFAARLNSLHPKLKYEVVMGDQHAIFLDLHIYKGPRFQQQGLLDLKVHQKSMNLYLYIPYTSFHTDASKRSFIQGELMRYIRNTSSLEEYCKLKHVFYQRLRDRGYPAQMLKDIFNSIWYADRTYLLWPASRPLTEHPLINTQPPRSHCLIKRQQRLLMQAQGSPSDGDARVGPLAPPVFIIPFHPLTSVVPTRALLMKHWSRLSLAINKPLAAPIIAYESSQNLMDRLVFSKAVQHRRQQEPSNSESADKALKQTDMRSFFSKQQ